MNAMFPTQSISAPFDDRPWRFSRAGFARNHVLVFRQRAVNQFDARSPAGLLAATLPAWTAQPVPPPWRADEYARVIVGDPGVRYAEPDLRTLWMTGCTCGGAMEQPELERAVRNASADLDVEPNTRLVLVAPKGVRWQSGLYPLEQLALDPVLIWPVSGSVESCTTAGVAAALHDLAGKAHREQFKPILALPMATGHSFALEGAVRAIVAVGGALVCPTQSSPTVLRPYPAALSGRYRQIWSLGTGRESLEESTGKRGPSSGMLCCGAALHAHTAARYLRKLTGKGEPISFALERLNALCGEFQTTAARRLPPAAVAHRKAPSPEPAPATAAPLAHLRNALGVIAEISPHQVASGAGVLLAFDASVGRGAFTLFLTVNGRPVRRIRVARGSVHSILEIIPASHLRPGPNMIEWALESPADGKEPLVVQKVRLFPLRRLETNASTEPVVDFRKMPGAA
jgi:hypothetical protein